MRLRPFGRTSLQLFLGATFGAAAVACSLSLDGKADYFAADAGPKAATSDSGAVGTDSGSDSGADGSVTVDAGDDPIAAGIADGTIDKANLLIHLSFDNDDSGSATAHDDSGNGRNGTLKGASGLPSRDLGHVGSGLLFDASKKEYVELPPDLLSGRKAVSFSVWVNLKSGLPWDRIFDFNDGLNEAKTFPTKTMYLSPTGWNTTTSNVGTHFGLISSSTVEDPMMLTETVKVNAWHHIALVIATPHLVYYVDGVEKFRSETVMGSPADMGPTRNDWLGRSAYTGRLTEDGGAIPDDPYFSGTMDEFKMYSGGLTAAEIATLAKQ